MFMIFGLIFFHLGMLSPYFPPGAGESLETSLYFLMVERSVHSWIQKNDSPNWFETRLIKKVRSRILTSFLGDPWLGNIPSQY